MTYSTPKQLVAATLSEQTATYVRQLALSALMTLLVLLVVAAPPGAIAQSPCADYISGGADNPVTGTLLGSRKVTETTNLGGGLNASVGGKKGGVGGSIGGNMEGGSSTTIEYYVGTYLMSDGDRLEVRCDNYTESTDAGERD